MSDEPSTINSDMTAIMCALAVKHGRSAVWVLDQYAQPELRREGNSLSLSDIRERQRERLGFEPSFAERVERAIAALREKTRDGS